MQKHSHQWTTKSIASKQMKTKLPTDSTKRTISTEEARVEDLALRLQRALTTNSSKWITFSAEAHQKWEETHARKVRVTAEWECNHQSIIKMMNSKKINSQSESKISSITPKWLSKYKISNWPTNQTSHSQIYRTKLKHRAKTETLNEESSSEFQINFWQ